MKDYNIRNAAFALLLQSHYLKDEIEICLSNMTDEKV